MPKNGKKRMNKPRKYNDGGTVQLKEPIGVLDKRTLKKMAKKGFGKEPGGRLSTGDVKRAGLK